MKRHILPTVLEEGRGGKKYGERGGGKRELMIRKEKNTGGVCSRTRDWQVESSWMEMVYTVFFQGKKTRSEIGISMTIGKDRKRELPFVGIGRAVTRGTVERRAVYLFR